MVFFVLNVKNDRLDATLIIIIFLAEYIYRCNFHFNFRQCNMMLGGEVVGEGGRGTDGLRRRILRSCRDLYSFPCFNSKFTKLIVNNTPVFFPSM